MTCLSSKYPRKSRMVMLTDSRDSAEVDGCSLVHPRRKVINVRKCTHNRETRGRGERLTNFVSFSFLQITPSSVRPSGCCRLNPKPRRGRSQLLLRDGRTKIEGRGKNSQVFTPSSSSSFSRRGSGATVGRPLPLLSRVSPLPKKRGGGGCAQNLSISCVAAAAAVNRKMGRRRRRRRRKDLLALFR